jgi:hypothetical protein
LQAILAMTMLSFSSAVQQSRVGEQAADVKVLMSTRHVLQNSPMSLSKTLSMSLSFKIYPCRYRCNNNAALVACVQLKLARCACHSVTALCLFFCTDIQWSRLPYFGPVRLRQIVAAARHGQAVVGRCWLRHNSSSCGTRWRVFPSPTFVAIARLSAPLCIC